jgi:Methyltransferase domain
MSVCRNCGGSEVLDLGPIGKVLPFFLKRALGMELRFPRSPKATKQKIRDLIAIPWGLLSRVTSQFAFVEMQLCKCCSFIQTSVPFPEDDLKRLYADYRSPKYNQERIHYEPDFATIAAAVGYDPVEIRARTAALNAFLHQHLPVEGALTILDYGGSDGRFIPDIPGSKFVYDISNVAPLPGVTRIQGESELSTYSLVLLSHVTEHVTHPLNLVRKLSEYVQPGGHLYIETPQETSEEQRSELRNGVARFDLGIHEHINYYCVPAVAALLEAAGFAVVATESTHVDAGWAKATHIRALGRKPLAH